MVQEVEDRIGELEVLQKVLREGVGTLSYLESLFSLHQMPGSSSHGKQSSENDGFHTLHVLTLLVKWGLQKRTTH